MSELDFCPWEKAAMVLLKMFAPEEHARVLAVKADCERRIEESRKEVIEEERRIDQEREEIKKYYERKNAELEEEQKAFDEKMKEIRNKKEPILAELQKNREALKQLDITKVKNFDNFSKLLNEQSLLLKKLNEIG